MIKYIWIFFGFIFFTVGTVAIFVPLLPTFPFYLATVFCFGRSSQRLHNWFIGTNLYKKHFESMVKRKEMPLKSKVLLILNFTFFMAIGFYFMKKVIIGKIILFFVWFFHVIYFAFKIKTTKEK